MKQLFEVVEAVKEVKTLVLEAVEVKPLLVEALEEVKKLLLEAVVAWEEVNKLPVGAVEAWVAGQEVQRQLLEVLEA